MKARQYRIESKEPLLGRLLPTGALKLIYGNPSLAVAIAVKSVIDPTRQQVRVVDVDSGEIVFETQPAELTS
ncbi:MAG: hypothetical protein V4772_09935 [Pseudomonadota bacterium]